MDICPFKSMTNTEHCAWSQALYGGGLTLAGVWDSSVLTEFDEEQWDPVFVSDPDTRRFLDSGELDIYRSIRQI